MASNQYTQYGGNPYNQAEMGESQYQQGEPYEMQNAPQSGQTQNQPTQQSEYVRPMSQRDFLQQVHTIRDMLKDFDISLQAIRNVHNRALEATDTSTDSNLGLELQNQETEALSRNAQISRLIQRLAQDAANTTDNTKSMKSQQVAPLKKDFQSKLQQYQNLEKDYRTSRQEQIRRQYLIVNPEATDSELAAVADESQEPGSQGVFMQALSNRRGQSQTALGAVKQRHAELQRIEQTMLELQRLFNDVEQLVVAQEPLVEHTEENAIRTEQDVERGNIQVDKAIVSARQRNKLKWYCLLIVVLICIAIALGVGLGVGLAKNATD